MDESYTGGGARCLVVGSVSHKVLTGDPFPFMLRFRYMLSREFCEYLANDESRYLRAMKAFFGETILSAESFLHTMYVTLLFYCCCWDWWLLFRGCSYPPPPPHLSISLSPLVHDAPLSHAARC